MKCFIASAFGHDDVDAVYDRCVIPVLRKLSITPLRVDRIEHNEDIDKKIFNLLDSADLAIADLTYARPSVYYEAGYAAGKSKPVIYIAKRDHLVARNDDPYGNFRVHFDLQMKNIIPWAGPDRVFSDKLLGRLQLVLRPLEHLKRKSLKLETERDAFSRLPMLDRLQTLERTGISLLYAHSFHNYGKLFSDFNGTTPTKAMQLRRIDKERFQAIGIITTSSASKRLFQYLSWNGLYINSAGLPPLRETHYIVVSLNSIPLSRATEGIPFYRSLNNKTLVSKGVSSRSSIKNITYIHIIDGIKSKSEFAEAFRAMMNENGLIKAA